MNTFTVTCLHPETDTEPGADKVALTGHKKPGSKPGFIVTFGLTTRSKPLRSDYSPRGR
jgi:hypothetical protein